VEITMAIVVHPKNPLARTKDILALLLIHWLDIVSLKDLAAKENLQSARVWRKKDARKKIAVKSNLTLFSKSSG
jgi:hypothetical protein